MEDLKDFIKKLPKIELHAHLNGSLSDEACHKLIELRRKSGHPTYSSRQIGSGEFRSLEDCLFEGFKLAHDLVDSVEAVKIAVECVISEFSDDNVVYLELRSTPRATEQMTKLEYLQAIIDTMTACQKSHPNIIVKFIPSINISYGVVEATANFQLFSELRKKHPNIVVALDLCGDPAKGKFADYKEIFQQARSEGFRMALHCAEVDNDNEILEMLEFLSVGDRIGHGTFIDDSKQEIWKLFREKEIPVEICLTSNLLCKTASSYEDHHIARLIKVNHPFVICTDDYGVFKTSLSNELKICAETVGLSEAEIVKLTVDANRYSFTTCDLERQLIADKIEIFKRESFS